MTVHAVELRLGGAARAERTALLIADLFALNILLQVVDALITYQSLELGFGEGNPLLRASMATHGTAMTLLLFKGYACGLLLLVRRGAPPKLGSYVLFATALACALFAIVPWVGKLLAVGAIRFVPL